MMINNLPRARRFLAEFWQKKPLLARQALTQFAGALDRARMIELAGRDDVESRLVIGARNRTLLVNGLENVVPAARRLQQAFSFIPYARHDDVMASYAVPGGSVGPHFDSYDVFLLQEAGERRWQISRQRDLDLVKNAPLKLLRRFRPQQAWTLRQGDLLYLPPRCAHYGVAVSECITWSIGFRAPGRQDMAERFLDFLRDHLNLDGAYRDPGLKTQRHPAVIGEDMLRQVHAMVKAIRFNRADVERCLGEYLTEPRANVVFGHARRMSAARFATVSAARGVRLSLSTRMLTHKTRVFINGESTSVGASARITLRELADRRRLLPRTRTSRATSALLYQWYQAGYIEPDDPSTGQ